MVDMTKLSDLTIGVRAQILSISNEDSALEAKLRELGIAESDEVEVLEFGLIGKTPILVRLNRTMLALRREEAATISIEVVAK